MSCNESTMFMWDCFAEFRNFANLDDAVSKIDPSVSIVDRIADSICARSGIVFAIPDRMGRCVSDERMLRTMRANESVSDISRTVSYTHLTLPTILLV